MATAIVITHNNSSTIKVLIESLKRSNLKILVCGKVSRHGHAVENKRINIRIVKIRVLQKRSMDHLMSTLRSLKTSIKKGGNHT